MKLIVLWFSKDVWLHALEQLCVCVCVCVCVLVEAIGYYCAAPYTQMPD